MLDYFHYQYQCPFLTSTEGQKIHCEGGCRICFTAVADCREYLQSYCAHKDQTWKQCTIAQAKLRRVEKNEELARRIKAWKTTKKRK